jgi:adenylosuccinate lyase
VNTDLTSGAQWFERTLDDSANRRLVLPEMFIATDAMLDIVIGVVRGLTVYPKVIEKRVNEELPFLASESIMMEAVKSGGNRQKLHEKIRKYSMETITLVKEKGADNDFMERIIRDEDFAKIKGKLANILNPKNFIGRASKQVTEYNTEVAKPLLRKFKKLLGAKTEFRV